MSLYAGQPDCTGISYVYQAGLTLAEACLCLPTAEIKNLWTHYFLNLIQDKRYVGLFHIPKYLTLELNIEWSSFSFLSEMFSFKENAWLVNSVFKNNQAFSSQGTEGSDKLETEAPVWNCYCNKICNQAKITMNMCLSRYSLHSSAFTYRLWGYSEKSSFWVISQTRWSFVCVHL